VYSFVHTYNSKVGLDNLIVKIIENLVVKIDTYAKMVSTYINVHVRTHTHEHSYVHVFTYTGWAWYAVQHASRSDPT